MIWVWCPNANSVPEEPFNVAEAYYPGDDYVDWVAVDGYNWGTSKDSSSWQSFDEIFGKPLADVARYAPGKPVMIAGATPGAVGTAVAQSELRTVLGFLNAHFMGQPELYIRIRKRKA